MFCCNQLRIVFFTLFNFFSLFFFELTIRKLKRVLEERNLTRRKSYKKDNKNSLERITNFSIKFFVLFSSANVHHNFFLKLHLFHYVEMALETFILSSSEKVRLDTLVEVTANQIKSCTSLCASKFFFIFCPKQ